MELSLENGWLGKMRLGGILICKFLGWSYFGTGLFYDQETNKDLEFLTNNFDLPALTIAKLYKQRWQVELFFKWIKQHLRIKAFFGTSANAVKTQIWIAISVYLLIAIIKKTLKLDESLYTLSQIFSISLFERTQNLSDFIKQDYKNLEPDIDDLFSLLGS